MPFDGDPLAFYGKHIIKEHHASLLEKLPDIKHDPDHRDHYPFDISVSRVDFYRDQIVAILGAGIGGLYTALILDSLDIKYEIFEASGRPGGRISTYRFPNRGTYDYFDEGAMRYPLPKKNRDGTYKNGTMKRLADLIEYPPLNKGSDPLKNKLIPVYMKARQSPGSKPGFYYFNGVHMDVPWTNVKKGDFNAKDMGVGADYIEAGSTAIQSDVINPFVRALVNDIQTDKSDGWTLMKENDSYSVRGYMASKYLPSYTLNLPPRHLSNDVINWCNLLEDSSSGGYDRALTQGVFDALILAKIGDIDYGDVEWKSFEGGSEVLTKKIEEYLKSRGSSIAYRKKVTAISETQIMVPSHDPRALPEQIPAVQVTTTGNRTTESKVYSQVISTLPLPVLRTINLNNAGLNVLQSNALRALDYGPTTKIAILFKSNWWTTKLGITGGQSFTDLPIRTIVYPSYGIDSKAPSKVLIASFTWTTDALRLGALASAGNKEELKELVLRNLAEAHAYYNKDITYKYLLGEYVDMHAKDWNNDVYTMGGYAKFSPGEFESLYSSLNFPAASNSLHFAGEAISTRHGWVVGALDSAWRAVYEYLTVTRQSDKIDRLKQIWGTNREWTTESTLATRGEKHDLLEEHLGLVNKAILAGVL